MKKGRKKYIIIIVVLLLYFIAMYLLFGMNEVKQRKVTTTLLVGDSTVWNYTDKKWMNVTSAKNIEAFNWKKFDIYINREKLGNYNLWHNGKWYVFDDNKTAISYTGLFFAYKSDFEMDIVDFESRAITDFTYVNQVLTNKGITPAIDYTVSTVTTLDFDQDGVEEEFYIVSNVFSDMSIHNYFSFVFMVKNNQIYMLYEDVDKNEGVNGCKPYINLIADVDNDKQNELILTCARYSNQIPIQMLYELEDDTFKIVISNQ